MSELCHGGSCFKRIFEDRDMHKQAAISIATQTACAVRFMHVAGVVHRDIKALNVFLCTKSLDEPLAMLGDFGGSRFVNREGENAEAKLISGKETPHIGTLGFRAPEMQPQDAYGPAVDIYAMGGFIFELA